MPNFRILQMTGPTNRVDWAYPVSENDADSLIRDIAWAKTHFMNCYDNANYPAYEVFCNLLRYDLFKNVKPWMRRPEAFHLNPQLAYYHYLCYDDTIIDAAAWMDKYLVQDISCLSDDRYSFINELSKRLYKSFLGKYEYLPTQLYSFSGCTHHLMFNEGIYWKARLKDAMKKLNIDDDTLLFILFELSRAGVSEGIFINRSQHTTTDDISSIEIQRYSYNKSTYDKIKEIIEEANHTPLLHHIY